MAFDAVVGLDRLEVGIINILLHHKACILPIHHQSLLNQQQVSVQNFFLCRLYLVIDWVFSRLVNLHSSEPKLSSGLPFPL